MPEEGSWNPVNLGLKFHRTGYRRMKTAPWNPGGFAVAQLAPLVVGLGGYSEPPELRFKVY